ncbi:MAG: hypothetical protein JST50_03105 [Bacteroidetes bacterium]|jgi:hypothetical protein|nr:hypothetical protein [Bacteroidota bacterium]
MKKITFLIIFILFSFICRAQQLVSLSDAVNINLPDKAEKISKEQAQSHASKKFKYDKMMLNTITDRKSDIYKVDDILISVHAESNNFKKEQLLHIKNGLDEMSKGSPTYTSVIKKVNGNSILVTSNIVNNIYHYHFFCFDNKNSNVITGILEFDKVDAPEARAILDQLINSIEFTK